MTDTKINNAGEKPAFVLLSLGSNLGDRIGYIEKAIEYIRKDLLDNLICSSFYKTEPVGFKNQPWFINAAVTGYSKLHPENFFDKVKTFENIIGRIGRERWHEREIDIDIIVFGTSIIHNDELDIPHPRLHERQFVLFPAVEIAPNLLHPELGKTMSELLAVCSDKAKVNKF